MAFNQVTNLDFEEVKSSLKNFMRSSETFSDYNFEGSVLSQLLDVLSYNTYYSALNANLVANEVFFDSASIRENVVSLAKLVGYVPRSAKAAKATITMDFLVTPSQESLTIKKGTAFVGANGEGTFVFSVLADVTREAYVDGNGIRRVTFTDIDIYQGNLLELNYTVDTTIKQSFIVPSADADVDLINVTIDQADNAVPMSYKPVKDITEITATDRIYFIQENKSEQFELIFGDGVFGRKLVSQDKINIEYLNTNKSAGNECSSFEFVGTITSGTTIITELQPTITVTTSSVGGAEPESVSSIKYLAPRYYSSQRRAVTVRDYETLVAELYPNLQSLSVYGGEEASPPQYGKVYIVAKPNGAEALTTTAKKELQKSIKKYTILTVIPEILDPSFLYLEITSFVYYDNNKTRRKSADIANVVRGTIQNFGNNRDLERFNGKFKYSKLVGQIDAADVGITSNITRIRMKKNIQALTNVFASYKICYGNVISQNTDLVSTGFKLTGEDQSYIWYLEKYGTDSIAIYRVDGNEKRYFSQNIGTIDYSMGEININGINISSSVGNTEYISVSLVPASNDIIALRDLYLTIADSDISVSTVLDETASSSRTSGVGQTPIYS